MRIEFEHFLERLPSEKLIQIGISPGGGIHLFAPSSLVLMLDELEEDFNPLAEATVAAYRNSLSEECVLRHALTAVLKLRGHYQKPNAVEIDQEFEEMVKGIEDEIKDHEVVVPLENLELAIPEFKIADVTIIPRKDPPDNRLDTFFSLFDPARDYPQDFEYVHSFAVLQVTAERQRATEIAIGKVKDALNVLRLFVGSGVIQGVQLFRNVRLIGETSVSSGRYVYLTRKRTDGTNGTGLITPRSRGIVPVTIGQEFVALLKGTTLPYVETVLRDRDGDKFKKKIYRAITWFGRGICAATDDEKFVSYIIALESLLIHTDYSKRSTLAKGVASLLASNLQEYKFRQKDAKDLYDLRSAIVLSITHKSFGPFSPAN